jgi:hypothetical protein
MNKRTVAAVFAGIGGVVSLGALRSRRVAARFATEEYWSKPTEHA